MKIGSQQQQVLDCLKGCSGRRWRNNGVASGWSWGSANNTERILEGLVRKGLVFKDSDGWYRPVSQPE